MQTRTIMREHVAFVASDALARAATRTGHSRSGYLRQIVSERLRADGFLKAPAVAEATA